MGHPKALLPLGKDTFLTRICQTCQAAGLSELVVVAGGPDLDAIAGVLDAAGCAARLVENPSREEGQLSSLLVGLAVADRPGVEAVVVNLVDVPLVQAGTVRAVIEAFGRTRAPVVRPVHRDGRHGHPVLFSRAVFDELRHADPRTGAKTVVRAHATAAVDVPIDDEGAFADVDTPDDYRRLIESASGT